MTTRVETILIEAGFGQAVIAGLNGTGDVTSARKVWAELRESVGYRKASAALLTSGASQQKLGKNSLPSYGLMLTPERGLMAASLRDVRDAFGLTGAFNLCPLSSKGCAAACLSRSGQSGMPAQQRAQAVRTAFILSHPAEAGLLIGAEIRNALRTNREINLRLNTTSDIRWEMVSPEMVTELSLAGVLMYDYTAWAPSDRAESLHYSLTYSAKEPSHTSDDYLTAILANKGNVAMPFTTARGEALPETWNGYRVIDGDKSDERRLDPRGVIVGLRAKGHEWKKDNSAGFIRASA
ncbi:hypothetical protein SEA_DARTHPHADER_89 [Mycobacterium phage DarthPhader]|uniref:Gene product 88 domain-containing protein n=1 Tax=Mycobacterium phage DarthPhader TaxID=1912975 RepID=A0A1I9S435_9CAUD|nr:hypothetical protein KIV60_gp12 [Mycobacterium phage DarthPhader]AOZ61329.1 hypothetical protein SEA_DARTHPHADER_89 [Mycobacterium phage DarthPhader]